MEMTKRPPFASLRQRRAGHRPAIGEIILARGAGRGRRGSSSSYGACEGAQFVLLSQSMDEEARSTLSELGQCLESLYGPRLIGMVLFGSRARGDHTPDSDVDLLVVLEGPVSPGEEIARTAGAVSSLSLRSGLVISCTFMDEDRYLHRAGPLLRNVRREGISL